MKLLMIFLVALFLSSSSFCQTDFIENATSKKSPWLGRVSNSIDSAFQLDKQFDFQFRLWNHPSLFSYASVFILTRKDNHWNARLIEYNERNEHKYFERKINQLALDSLWSLLVQNQVLALPPEDSIQSKLKTVISDTIQIIENGMPIYRKSRISDGNLYLFELSTPSKKRSYAYYSPGIVLKYYPNIEEMHFAFSLIVLIKKYIGDKMTAD